MKKTSEWAVALSLCFLITALIAFMNRYFVDATILGLYAASGIFFIITPKQYRNNRWNSYKLISYILFICGIAVSMFKYIFLEANPI